MALAERNRSPHVAGRSRSAWTELARSTPDVRDRFDPATLASLPPPAQRLLRRALPAGVALSPAVELTMQGEIRLGRRWLRFTADQILVADRGFVWSAIVGGPIVRFVGADLLTANDARMEFRLHRLIPVVRASGSDLRRSAQGRLAAETVAWLPQALTPQLGAEWTPVDDERAIVALAASGATVEVEVCVTDDGGLQWLGLDRWNDSAKPPSLVPFGGTVESSHAAANGVQLAGSGTVGWAFRTDGEADGRFFRYRITGAHFHPDERSGAVG